MNSLLILHILILVTAYLDSGKERMIEVCLLIFKTKKASDEVSKKGESVKSVTKEHVICHITLS